MILKEINKADRAAYFTLAQEFGSVFNSPDWLTIYGDTISKIGIYDKDNFLIGGFFVYSHSKMGLKHINNPPFTPNIGLFFQNKSQSKSAIISFEKSIMLAVATYLKSAKFDLLTIALSYNFIDLQPFIWEKYKVIPNYSYRLNLTQTKEELWAKLSSDKRNSWSKIEKDGIEINKIVDYNVVKQLVLKTFSRKEKKINLKILDSLLFTYANPKNSFAFAAYKKNLPIAVAFCIHHKDEAYYILGGYDAEQKHQGAGTGVVWRSILEAQQMNLKIFDFEGSMMPEVENFFRGFGADLTPYFTINKATIPLELLLKFAKREIF